MRGGLGAKLGDDNDRYRTAAVQLSYKDFSTGFNLFTGERGSFDDVGEVFNAQNILAITGAGLRGKYGEAYPYGFAEENDSRNPLSINPPRLGALYIGYKGLRSGIDSDRHVRHPIQNVFAHGFARPQPYFRSYSNAIHTYSQYQSFNKFTLW